MDIGTVLTDILIVLVAAKAAAEVAERLGVPAVVGEILAGLLIGPSLLGLVDGHDEVLKTLGELGVILLLLEVGMEMDLAELGKVGRASLSVATVGVVMPMAMGIGAMALIGTDLNTALFVGAALTATSVGITARVFGDLRALATTEARIVLGAAVADDVMGLIVLTVVVRMVTEGSVSVLSVGWIILVALLFLVVGAIGGLRLSGPLFEGVARLSRSTGTMVALALAFTLGFARLAALAKLAPIVGAFVAGIALTRSDQSERIRRELAPVGHLFVPVFFLQIGIEADIGVFGKVSVLRDAAILLAVAVAGKLVAAVGAVGSPGDKLLIGLGMLPRGEVGLIFATIGLANGVLDQDLYAALLIVVLVTTLATPQLLKLRYGRLRAAAAGVARVSDERPPGGWLVVDDGTVELVATPSDVEALEVALRASILVARNEPGPLLMTWLASVPDAALQWRRDLHDLFLDVVERGNARSWRFLETTGVLGRAIPELADALRARQDDPFTMDMLSAYRFAGLERLRRLQVGDPLAFEAEQLTHRDRLLLALLLVEALDSVPRPEATADAILRRLGVHDDDHAEVLFLVGDRQLLWAAATRAGGLGEEAVLQLASHLDSPERARALDVLSALIGADRARWEQDRLRELSRLVQAELDHDELTGVETRNLIGRRRTEALAMAADEPARDRIARAPRSYVLRQSSAAIARHAALFEPPLGGGEARVRVTPAGTTWWVDVAARDRHGLLAHATGALARHDLDVVEAIVATWPDHTALESFRVAGVEALDAAGLEADIESAFDDDLSAPPLPEAVAEFDSLASPWHTVCELTAPDKPGLLHVVATAFAAAGVEVVAASANVSDGVAYDRFELVDGDGHKLTREAEERIGSFLGSGVSTRRGWFRRRTYQPAVVATSST